MALFRVRRWDLVYLAILILVCLIEYRGIPGQPWSYDDLDHIERAERAQGNFGQIYHSSSKEPTRIFLNTYFYLAYPFFLKDPAGWHLANLVVHILNGFLCFLFVRALSDVRLGAGTGLLFCVGCAGYEAVYEISAFGVALGTTFGLLSALCLLAYSKCERSVWMVGSSFAYLGAILFYESFLSLALPLAYLVWTRAKRSWMAFAGIAVPVLCFAVLEGVFYRTAANKVAFNALSIGFHIPYNLALFVGRLLICPHFSPFGWDAVSPYDLPASSFDFCAGVGLATLIGIVFLSTRVELARLACFWMVGTVLPYVLNAQQWYFPRYFYLASVGGAAIWAAVLIWAIDHLSVGAWLRRSVLIGVTCLLAGLSIEKARLFEGWFVFHAANYSYGAHQDQTALDLYLKTVEEYRLEHALIYQNLGAAYFKLGEQDRAFEWAKKSINQNPSQAGAHKLLTNIYFQSGNMEAAVRACVRVAEIDPSYLERLKHLAGALQELGYEKESELALKAYSELK